MHPYRHAPTRALAPARWWHRWADLAPGWWLDLVGAAYVLWWSGHARDRYAAATAEQEGWLLSSGCWRVGPTPSQRQVLTGGAVGIQAGGDLKVRLGSIDLTRAPPRVATGAVDEPARLAPVAILNDEARAAARKGG